MERWFVRWLADWLKCWMQQRRKSSNKMRCHSLENFCCISLWRYLQSQTDQSEFMHTCETKWETSGKTDEGQKRGVFLSEVDLLLFFKNWLSTHVIVAASQMGTLTSCWEIIEITCFRRRSVERFGERAASHDFFGAKLIFEETCACRARRPPFDVWLPYKCDRRQELHISIRTSPDCSEVGW